MSTKLSPKLEDQQALSQRVEIYNKMLRTCQIMYEGTDRVIDTIGDMVSTIRIDKQTTPASDVPLYRPTGAALQSRNNVSHGWIAALLQNPTIYGRVIVGLDVSLSLGRKLHPNDVKFLMSESHQTTLYILPTMTTSDEDAQDGIEKPQLSTRDVVASNCSIRDALMRAKSTEVFEMLLQGYTEAGAGSEMFIQV